MGKTDGIRYGTGQFDGLPIFAPPEPPTGPQTDVRKFTGEGGEYRGYVWWRSETEDGRRVFAYIEQGALVAAEKGKLRISPRSLVAQTRMRLKLEINDHYSAWIADDLVARHPHLLPLIERRARRKAKV